MNFSTTEAWSYTDESLEPYSMPLCLMLEPKQKAKVCSFVNLYYFITIGYSTFFELYN